ncbi:hypothetical protein LCGC14_1372030 [marine sediment metagenome]|uniref:Polymerase beta nucleotidyltransferase domain-containing protein n=1 Tax=marine sediment metagenome TaxID=412755 RepID=A0A0F9KR37_9ZZZZ
MVKEQLLKKIRNDFNKIITAKDIIGILLYGSHISNGVTNRSDIDVCIVAPTEDPYDLISYIRQNINVDQKRYDIRIFKELPIYIKIQIIEEGRLIYSPNKFDLYEYFYLYRKIWADQKNRQHISKQDLLQFLD